MTVTDIPRLYTALAEWLGCMVYLAAQKRRVDGWRLAMGCVVALGIQCAMQLLAGALPLSLWLVGMLLNALCQALVLAALCDITLPGAFYCAARAFTAAEFAASLQWQLRSFFLPPDTTEPWDAALLLLVYGLCFGAMLPLERRQFTPERRFNVPPRECGTALLTAAIVFTVSNISFVWPNTPFSSEQQNEIFYIRTLVDFCGIVLLYMQHEQYRLSEANRDVEAIQVLLQRQYDQYRQSKRSIKLLNRRYHELKCKIADIRAAQSAEGRDAIISEMEKDIRLATAVVRTGNAVLDTLLADAQLRCAEEGVTLAAVADGQLLDFVSTRDLSTLVGTALDNAIECAAALPDPEKRQVRLAVFRQGELAMLRLENYFEGELTFEDGLPAVPGQGREHGGVGVKSIRYTAEKYGGSVRAHTADHWFSLCVLLPLPEGE